MSFWNLSLTLVVVMLVIYILLKETNTPKSSPSPTPTSLSTYKNDNKTNIVLDIPYNHSYISQPYYPQSMPRNVYLDYVNNGNLSYPPYYPGYNYTWDPYFYNWNPHPVKNTEKIENKVDNKPNISINNIIPTHSPKSLMNLSKKVSQPLLQSPQPTQPTPQKPISSMPMPTYSP